MFGDDAEPMGRLVLTMNAAGEGVWKAEVCLNRGDVRAFGYRYIIMCGESVARAEHDWRTAVETPDVPMVLRDVWCDNPLPDYFRKEAFGKVAFPHFVADDEHDDAQPKIEFRLQAPPGDAGEYAIVGDGESLGFWDTQKAVPLKRRSIHEWYATFAPDSLLSGANYKYVRLKGGEIIWEEGENRKADAPPADGTVIYNDGTWRGAVQAWRGAGVVVPLFSIKTHHTFGVGDMSALTSMVEWCASVGMKALQLLPINDTSTTGTWRDSYPYNSLSVFALHPMYLDIKAMGELADDAERKLYDKWQSRLNASPTVDYEQVNRHKWYFIRLLFDRYGEEVMRSAAYAEFYDENKEWLDDYAWFCHFKDKYGTSDFRTWPRHSEYDGAALTRHFILNEDDARGANLYRYVQYELHRQLAHAKGRAAELGVILKGDIPIGISRDSDSAWVSPHLFHFDGQAGAPPDAFAADGQNWGFPTYNWAEHEREGYAWWRRRLRQMSLSFDAYRIDHVLGFFRIWEIPYGNTSGLLGSFSPAIGLPESEMSERGFTIRPEYLRPHLSIADLVNALGNDASLSTAKLFDESDDFYTFKPGITDQSSLLRFMESDKALAALPTITRKVLMKLMTEVLFVRDKSDADLYHPRIGASSTYEYSRLLPTERKAFDDIYNDYFYHRNNALWQAEAMKKLSVITRTGEMLPCAEDLGMIPHGVREVLQRLSLLSLEIQTMPKEPWVEFADTAQYPYLSVATFATHDMPPLRNMWAENPDRAQRFYHNALGMHGNAPREATIDVCREVLFRHLASPSMLCLMSIQDWTAAEASVRSEHYEDEQINHPENPNQKWDYRMHLAIEEIAESADFTRFVSEAIARSGR